VSVKSLNCDEVVRIHYVVCADFADEDDPVGYGGIRDQGLLESAVHRQHAGWGPFRKYGDPWSNAATLTYGICNDHPFRNGNKRTALVCMLAHLDKNRLTLKGEVRQRELFDLMLELADHALGNERIPMRARKPLARRRFNADHQVEQLTDWLRARVTPIKRGERQLTYRQLRHILPRHGYSLGQPSGSNLIEVWRDVEVRKGILRRQVVTEQKLIGRIGYRNEGETVSVKTMKELRRICRLTAEDGVDSDAFYDGADVVDAFVNEYRGVLRRLAKT
jgi:death-on-curing protein